MPSHMLKTAAVALASTSAVLLSGTPSSAADVQRNVAHGTATAQGTRTIQKTPLNSTLVVRGELTNTGNDCYSVWFQFTHRARPGRTAETAEASPPGPFRNTPRNS
ncbi:hypothetical protein GA0115233_109125 [Streptomyces sp. DI166]|nr:hypothetical protein GA0115233_109125 [Streptomyces sp. DI166]